MASLLEATYLSIIEEQGCKALSAIHVAPVEGDELACTMEFEVVMVVEPE